MLLKCAGKFLITAKDIQDKILVCIVYEIKGYIWIKIEIFEPTFQEVAAYPLL